MILPCPGHPSPSPLVLLSPPPSPGILKGLITGEISPVELLLSLLSLDKWRGEILLSLEFASNLDANTA